MGRVLGSRTPERTKLLDALETDHGTEALFQLTSLENPSRSEVEAIELLRLFVDRYEQDRYPVTGPTQFQLCGFFLNGRISPSVT
jgi:hypothetical protein